MFKPFSLIFFVLVLVWLGSIFITSDAQLRIERSCVPVAIGEKIVTAGTQLAYEPWAESAQRMMLKAEYGCRYLVWKTFYEQRDAPVRENAAPTSAGTIAEPAPAKGAHEPTETQPYEEVSVDAPRPAQPGRTAPLAPSNYFDQK